MENINEPEGQPLWLSVGPSFTMVLPILLMALAGSRVYGNNKAFLYMGLITGGTSALLGAMWAINNYFFRKSSFEKKVMKMKKEYASYLDNKDEYLGQLASENRELMLGKYRSLAKISDDDFDSIKERFIEDDDFLFVRLGTGKIRFQVNVRIKGESRNLFETLEEKKARELVQKYQYIDGCPIGVNFKDTFFLGICMPRFLEETYEILLNMFLQITSYTSPSDVKVCIFLNNTNEYQRKFFECIKFIPHLFTNNNEKRLAGTDAFGSLNILLELSEHIKNSDNTKWIVFILDDEYICDETQYQSLFQQANENTSVILLTKKCNLPGIVKEIMELGKYSDSERVSFDEARRLSLKIMTRVSENNTVKTGIPNSVDILDMYNVSTIESLKIEKNWSENKPWDRIKVPIGLRDGSKITYLDIHEKYHGPHGLIAGTTGSGKSELIQTFIISLSINYSPLYVNFFLIDYKGGGTGNIIDQLPHCAGSVSNLSGNEMRRAMQALTFEVKRRETALSLIGVNHIDGYEKKYSEGLVSEPMPHLVLIVDEFAELKKEEPEFMKEIISLAAVGRSLGIHLILATQKPAGVVDDKIWSNSNFKLCLRVQDRQDSMDMLHRPEASYLTSPGQCYIEIGNNTFFDRFQTAYCGNDYNPALKVKPKVYLLDDNANKKSIEPKREEGTDGKDRTVLNTVVNYVNSVSGDCRAKKLWTNAIGDYLELDLELCKLGKEDVDGILCKPDAYILGKYDDPNNQRQGLYLYTPKKDGSIIVIGRGGSGKTTLLNTIINVLMPDDELVLIDINDNSLLDYESSNLIGRVNKSEDIAVFMYHLKRKYKERLKEKDKGNLFVLIDNFASFYSKLGDDGASFIEKLIKDGPGRGVYTVATGSLLSDFSTKLMGVVKTTIAMEMNDRYSYRDILRMSNKMVLPKPDTPGRALAVINNVVFECQIAKVKSCEKERLTLCKPIDRKKLFPSIPENRNINSVIDSDEFKECIRKKVIPIGYSTKTGYLRGIEVAGGISFMISEYSKTALEIMKIVEMTIARYPEILEGCEVVCSEDMHLISNEPDFLIGIFDPLRDSDLMMDATLSKYLKDESGIYVGNNPMSSRLLSFNDLSFSELNQPLKKNEGLLRIKGREHTVKIRLLSLYEDEDIEED